MAPFIAWVLVG